MVEVGELPPEGVVLAGVVAPLDGVVAPLEGVVEPVGAVPVLEVDVLLDVVEVEVLAATAGGAVGTLNCGAPVVSAVPVPPPPQAASPSPMATEIAIAGKDLDLRVPSWLMPTRKPSGAERLHAPAAAPGSR